MNFLHTADSDIIVSLHLVIPFISMGYAEQCDFSKRYLLKLPGRWSWQFDLRFSNLKSHRSAKSPNPNRLCKQPFSSEIFELYRGRWLQQQNIDIIFMISFQVLVMIVLQRNNKKLKKPN
jgi:hypothetical protein